MHTVHEGIYHKPVNLGKASPRCLTGPGIPSFALVRAPRPCELSCPIPRCAQPIATKLMSSVKWPGSPQAVFANLTRANVPVLPAAPPCNHCAYTVYSLQGVPSRVLLHSAEYVSRYQVRYWQVQQGFSSSGANRAESPSRAPADPGIHRHPKRRHAISATSVGGLVLERRTGSPPSSAPFAHQRKARAAV